MTKSFSRFNEKSTSAKNENDFRPSQKSQSDKSFIFAEALEPESSSAFPVQGAFQKLFYWQEQSLRHFSYLGFEGLHTTKKEQNAMRSVELFRGKLVLYISLYKVHFSLFRRFISVVYQGEGFLTLFYVQFARSILQFMRNFLE